MPQNNDFDAAVVVGALIVFSLPLTLLIPGFSVWDLVPKFSITRFHILSVENTWPQLNAIVVTTLLIFFCLYLETRKRRLEDMVENVLTVSEEADATISVERERQAAASRACVELLDTSTEQYEHLILLHDELRRREKATKQRPPVIELSSSEFT